MANRRRLKSNNKAKIIIAIALVLVELLVFFSGYFLGVHTTKKSLISDDAKTTTQEELEANKKSKEEELVDNIMKDMSISDMIYQMMFVTPEAITNVGTVVRAGETTKKALEKYPVGGIVYFAQNFENREQTIEMISKTQEFSNVPLFISVDEEGGRVARLGSNPAMGTTKQPPMKTIGDSKEPQKAYDAGKTMGSELSELGFNVDFAPDADVIINSNNKEIGDRSFGTDPELVSKMVENAVKGLQDNGVSATLKHFPGHGSTYVDSHTGYSESNRTIDELRTTEFLPFKSGIDAGADFIMISHMTLVNATKEKVPSSISKEVITDMLINELGYKGIIITDSFSMGAITKEYSTADAAVRAVNAGVDMILMPSDLAGTHGAILEAVESGEISQERIEESVRKILLLKAKKKMIN